MNNESLSILNPAGVPLDSYKLMSPVAWHDLGMDQICDTLTAKEEGRTVLRQVMMNLCPNPEVSAYREAVFEDILNNPAMRNNIMEFLEKVKNLQDYMSTKRNIDKSDSIWTLTRRLKEVNDYISCIEAMSNCLSSSDLHSEGLLQLRDYMKQIQEDCSFAELKEDIAKLYKVTNKVRSVTLGINLDENYDAESVGVVSLNDKAFTHAHLLSAFGKKLSGKDQVQQGCEWNGKLSYDPVSFAPDSPNAGALEKTIRTITAATNPLQGVALGMMKIQSNTDEVGIVGMIDDVANRMLASSVKEMKSVLAKHATVSIYSITNLIPEFLYYILWANFIEKQREKGYQFSRAEVIMESADADASLKMQAYDIYNLKLAVLSETPASDIVGNDLDFNDEHCVYILTGANRGGKTTITQAIGQQYVMAQGGIYVAGAGFRFKPVDGIYTHFPADEDKTLDFGRLGEECNRFKSLYTDCSEDSLLLLNETFSTTSFEEGYYIAYDSIRAILKKGIRTIYNTHMHKLAREIDSINAENTASKAASLVVQSEGGKRSYKVKLAPATGNSFAKDIAEKYGVTFEQLTGE